MVILQIQKLSLRIGKTFLNWKFLWLNRVLCFCHSSKVSAMAEYIFPLKLGSLVLALFWRIMMFSIWIWTACTSMVSACQSNRWNEILTLTLLIGIYAIDFKRASLDTPLLIHWQEKFLCWVHISYCYIYFYHVLIVFKNRKWSDSFFFCIHNDDHQTWIRHCFGLEGTSWGL